MSMSMVCLIECKKSYEWSITRGKKITSTLGNNYHANNNNNHNNRHRFICTADQRCESVSCVCVNQCCEQIAHIFRRKKDCWAEKCELSQLYYSLQPSPSSRHIKGVCLHSTICLPSSKKKKKTFRRIGMCFWPYELSTFSSQSPIQLCSVRIQER